MARIPALLVVVLLTYAYNQWYLVTKYNETVTGLLHCVNGHNIIVTMGVHKVGILCDPWENIP